MTLIKWARAVKERDGWRCQECGSVDNLHAHHIKPRSMGGENTLENGKTLCLDCHRAVHTGELNMWQMHRKAKPRTTLYRFREILTQSGLNQAEVARRMGVPYNAVNDLVNGRKRAKADLIVAFLKATGMTEPELKNIRFGDVMNIKNTR